MKRIPTLCLNCSTVCGMVATVDGGRILKLEGNPRDPNSRGKLCAKGQAAINMVEDPDRLRYPLKRVGRRGSGQWQRISWQEAVDTIAERLRRAREAGHPERVMLQYGRDRTNGFLDRFMDALGSPNKLGHRGLCSLNKRMAIRAMIGDTDWDTADFAHARLILNFGSNFFEAHQGHVAMVQRVQEARRQGARLVTFDVRLSNTAAKSDEWIPLIPGTDGLVALAMGQVMLEENLVDIAFLEEWTNAPVAVWKASYRNFTPEWAAEESGVPAETIRRLAREFAKAAPQATTVSNRGAHAHENGFDNERAIVALNALAGTIGQRGGWNYTPGDVNQLAPQPGPVPPRPRIETPLSHPPGFGFANRLYPRAISSTIYPDLQDGRVSIEVLISYYVNAPMSWPEGPDLVRETLLDETRIPFHVAIDAFPSETVETADLVLPDATFLERWDLDARNSYSYAPYVGLRQPVVAPPGECRDIRDILSTIARSVDETTAAYFPYESAESFVRAWAEAVPGGLEALQKEGIWVSEPKYRDLPPFLRPVEVSLDEADVAVDERGVVTRRGTPVGRLSRGQVVQGFNTPDRRFQFLLADYADVLPAPYVHTGPQYRPISVEGPRQDDEFYLVSFKWNVHTQSRTANQPWLTDIVGDNPCWIHPEAARKLGIQEGDWVGLSRVRPRPRPDEIRARAHLTPATHRKVVAISASFGHWQYGRNAKGRGVNPNRLIPAWTDPVGGGQAWNDTIVRVRGNGRPGGEGTR